jgi:EAL domain-containing protein (putative c-di-GMP-specific phosphodiesterase class I)
MLVAASKASCQQARAWQQQGLPLLTIAVNLSARQFQRGGLIQVVDRVLDETGLDATLLELELTESLLMKNTDEALATLTRLKDRGIKLSIDDFGTGYSSLGYLTRFPVDRVKIDQSFVRDLATDPNDAAIAKAVIAMAHSLRLSATAEGVETAEQLAFLRGHRCNEVQGYYFSRPLPPDQLAMFLHQTPTLAVG